MLKRTEIFAKHYGKGSKCPPVENGTNRVYNMAFCPYGHRVLLVAEAKKFPIDILNVDLNDGPEWMHKKGISGVPVLERDNGSMINESLEICENIDKMSPNAPSILPESAERKKEDKIWAKKFYDVVQIIFPLFFRVFDNQSATPLLKKMTEELKIWDAEIKRRGTKFYGGDDAPGYLDYAIWPFVERLPILKLMFPGAYDFAGAKAQVPNFERWRQDMEKDPAVLASFLNTQQHFTYIQNRRDVSQGKKDDIDYDFVLKN